MYYIIVFESLRFHPSTRSRKNSFFKKFHSGERLRKVPFSLDTCGRKPYPYRKSCVFKSKRVSHSHVLNPGRTICDDRGKKCLDHVQSCCFAYLNPLLFCCSRSCRRRRILSFLIASCSNENTGI